MKLLMTGNEAIARGAYEAGVRFASAYPGTPSTEILENVATYKGDIVAEWATNEKVALEAAIGGSLAGARTMASMKHVGVNVAADPLFTFSYTGVNGGMVLISADEPGMHSSQNEQDNRNYAKFAKIAMFEPSSSQEAKDMLSKRADAFVKASEKCNLEILPYIDGFFVSIPCEDPKAVSEELTKDNVFVVPLKKGLRFAVCAVSEEKCAAAPSIIKNALEYVRSQNLAKA